MSSPTDGPDGAAPPTGDPLPLTTSGTGVADSLARIVAGHLEPEARARAAAVYVARGVLTPRESQAPDASAVIALANYIVKGWGED